jgi:hypothetical protein
MSKTAASLATVFSLSLVACLTAACEKHVEAPLDPGVCFAVVETPQHTLKYNKLATNIKNLEYCSAELERMRLGFLRLGGSTDDVTGAYQGHFIFLPPGPAIYTSETYDGPRYVAMVRYGDKLVLPGAVPQ